MIMPPPEESFEIKSSMPVIASYDYKQQQQEFIFSTFLNQIQVVKTYAKIRIECDRLATQSVTGTGVTATLVGAGVGSISGLCMYVTYVSKIVRIDEFEQIQIQSLQNARSLLKERYVIHFY
jgi:hypothetical protein